MGLPRFTREEDDRVQGRWVDFGNSKHILLGLLDVMGIVCGLVNNEWAGGKKIKAQIWF